ncbi:MFS transporter (plasmid) [Rhizobium rhizogenes]|uniref:MFS transporter n=1 Tax=Rhizobium rhizogenes TaxID=359 RepID=UPI001573F5E4|nr:MFS transporter [Rhizobium rhizogenes]NTI26539.1 MFS transporter [Rhizobium rhizogenes]QTG10267.1 MFS transporter [Rhizobium rhizogenes]
MEIAASHGIRTDRAAVTAVVLGVTAFAVAQGLTYPLITLVLQQRGETDAHIGLNAFFYAAGFACATLTIDRLMRLLRGDILIIAGLSGCALSLLTMSAFDGFWVWCALRFLLGLCASSVFIISEAWLNTACSENVRGRVSGLYGAGLCGGFAVGPLAIPLFGTQSGLSFAVTAIYVAAIAFFSALLTRRATTLPKPSRSKGLIRFMTSAPLLTGMVFMYGFADIAAISAMPAYLVHMGFSQAFAATAVTMVALPTAVSQPIVGWLLDRVNRPAIAVAASVLASASFLMIPFIESGAAFLVAFAILGAASFALYTCALTLLGERYAGDKLMTGSAAFSLAYAAGSGSGSTVVGAVMSEYSLAAGPITIGVALAIFALAYAASERRKFRSL